MDRLIHVQVRENLEIRQVCENCIAQFKLNDERGMLHETLIVFRPGGRKFTRGVKSRYPDRIPAATETGGTCTGKRHMRPARYEGTPER